MKHIFHYTFISITYNHEKSILRHLKSVITQIITHHPKSVELIIIDDFSTDNTVHILKEWIKLNSHYFQKIDLQLNSKNIGIKANYSNVMRINKNPYYKLLAGDDAYVGNIFEFMEFAANHDVVFSPLITCISKKFYFKDYLFGKTAKGINNKIIMNLLLGNNLFNAPGAYVHPRVFESGLSDYLEHYLDRSHEDIPSWMYLFVISDKSYEIYPSPICIYYPNNNRYTDLVELIRYILSSSVLQWGSIFQKKKYNTMPKNFKYYLRSFTK